MSPLPIKTGHLFIGAAIILGLVTMLMVGTMNRHGGKKLQVEKIETIPVVVPTSAVMKGETLTLDKLKVVKWPKGYLPQGATYQTTSPLVGRVPLQDLMPGEPIYSQKLSDPNTDGLTALIPAGHRAITIAVTETKGVAGFVKPGDRVDILCTFNLSGKRDDGSRNKYFRTVTLVQDVEVLASAQTMVDDKDDDMETPQGVVDGELKSKRQVAEEEKENSAKSRRKKTEDKPKNEKELVKERKAAEKAKRESEKRAKLVSSVTISVTPSQAQQIALAEEAGDLRLVMRAAKDIVPASVEATESEDVVYPAGSKKPAPPPPPMAMPKAFMAPPPAPKNEVEVIEGVDKRSVEF